MKSPTHLYVKKMSVFRILFVVIAGGFLACRQVPGYDVKENAISAANEIAFIADRDVWESHVGDTVTYYFEAPYPIMPQPEPIFDIRHFTTEDLIAAPLRKELRTYVILADLQDHDSGTTKMLRADLGEEKLRRAAEDSTFFTTAGMDKWATGQLVIYIFGSGIDDLARKIVAAYPVVTQRIQEHDIPLIEAAAYLNDESLPIQRRINEKFGVTMKIPGDYRIAVDTENFLWIRQDFDEAISGITIMRFPYESRTQFELEEYITMRDRMGQMVEGGTPGSFMITNDDDLPVYLYRKEIDGHFALEARGIWELTQDFLGGPFIGFAVVDGNSILMIDGFVHAPAKNKREYIQRLERVLTSLKFE
jgi:hypothetical protein